MNKFKVNDIIEESFSYTQEQVNLFIELTGDNNPIHFDKEFAKSTVFKKPIVHGMLSSSIFSKILGVKMPGEGTIYLKQELNFIRPVFVDELYFARLEIKDIENNRYVIETNLKDSNGRDVLTGYAIVLNNNSNI